MRLLNSCAIIGHLLSVTPTPFRHNLLPQFWHCLALNPEVKLVKRVIPTAKKVVLNSISTIFLLLKY